MPGRTGCAYRAGPASPSRLCLPGGPGRLSFGESVGRAGRHRVDCSTRMTAQPEPARAGPAKTDEQKVLQLRAGGRKRCNGRRGGAEALQPGPNAIPPERLVRAGPGRAGWNESGRADRRMGRADLRLFAAP